MSQLRQTQTILEKFKEELKPELEELGLTDDTEVISLRVNDADVEAGGKAAERIVAEIDVDLESEAPESLTARQLQVSSKIEDLKAQLAEPQRLYLA